jgi:hypothetical protein
VIATVVLTYRAAPAMLAGCVQSVVRSGDAALVIVVDNGASIDPAALPAGVVVITPGANRGYAGGMNVGVRHALAAGASSVAVLNDDTVVPAGWLGPLGDALDVAHRVGAAQPKLLLGDAAPPRIQSVGVRWRGDGAGVDIGYGEVDTGQYDDLTTVDIFTGGAVLLAREFLEEVGGFDERYFLYYEDVDLALRGRRAGWSYRLVPSVAVRHEMSSTSGARPDQRRYWQERNRLWCLFRHGTAVSIARGLALSGARLARVRSLAQARAVMDGVAGAPRMLRERRRPTRWAVT